MTARLLTLLLGLALAIDASTACPAETTGATGTGATKSTKAATAKTAGAKAGGAKAPAAKSAQGSTDLNLDGVWRGFVVEGKGEKPDRGTVQLELTIQGNHISAKRLDGQGGSLGEGVYKMTTERFYQMDATEVRSRGKPKAYLGICAFAPDTMKWCVATPNSNRPTDFETKGQQFLLILKRQKQ